MTELYLGAWHVTESHVVEPLEKEGLPDFQIRIPSEEYRLFLECKRLRAISPKRIRKVITKANSQIKNAVKAIGSPAYGVVVLDVTTPLTVQTQTDEAPEELKKVRGAVQSAIDGHMNRSVGSAIVVWDDYAVFGKPPKRTMVGFRRRYHRLVHSNPALTVPEHLRLFDGYTITYTLHWTLRGRTESSPWMKWVALGPLIDTGEWLDHDRKDAAS
jgi:hypothetical protein